MQAFHSPALPCLALVLACTGGGAAAQAAADSLASPACAQALAALQAQEAQLLAAGGGQGRAAAQAASKPGGPGTAGDAAPLQALRQQAARACLGGASSTAPAVQRLAQPPLVVAPIGAPRPAAGTAVAPQATPLPPIPLNRAPAVLTTCDGTGCWASDGTRLNRVGPLLPGAAGPCMVVGGPLDCAGEHPRVGAPPPTAPRRP